MNQSQQIVETLGEARKSSKVPPELLNKARELGKKGLGKFKSPAQDPDFMELIKSLSDKKPGSTIELLDAWIEGFSKSAANQL